MQPDGAFRRQGSTLKKATSRCGVENGKKRGENGTTTHVQMSLSPPQINREAEEIGRQLRAGPKKKGHEKGNAVESDCVRHPKKAETAGRERGKPRPAPGSWGLLRRAEKTRKGRSRSLRNLEPSHRGQEASGISAHDLTPVVCPQADSEEGSHSRSLRNDRQAKREKHILALWKGLHTLEMSSDPPAAFRPSGELERTASRLHSRRASWSGFQTKIRDA